MEREYSMELAECVREFLDEHEGTYSYDEDAGLFQMLIPAPASVFNRLPLYLLTGERDILIAVEFPIRICPENFAEVREVIVDRCFNQKWGSFRMDPDSGILSYNVMVDCIDRIPDDEVLETAIGCAHTTMSEFSGMLLRAAVGLPVEEPKEGVTFLKKMMEHWKREQDAGSRWKQMEDAWNAQPDSDDIDTDLPAEPADDETEGDQ